MSPIVAAADAAQFLSLVPALLGFHPARSVVAVPLARGRSLGALRVDVPDEGADAAALASSITGLLCRVHDADAAVFVVYPSVALDGGSGPETLPYAELVEAFEKTSAECGLQVVDALVVGTDGWASYRAPEAGIRPLADLAPVDPPDRGGAILPDQEAGADLPAVDAARCAAVERALEDAVEIVRAVAAPASVAECSFDGLPGLYEAALDGDPAALDPARVAMLLWCMHRPNLRDIALVQWSGDRARGDTAQEAQRRWEEGEEYPIELAMVVWGDGARPDPARLERALGLTRYLAAVAPVWLRPGPLAMSAWISWALGRSTHAAKYTTTSAGIDPEHVLTGIVQAFVLAGHLPDWAFRRGRPVRRG